MHELGLCESLLEAVERRAGGRRVTAVRLRAGALHRVHEGAMGQAFELVAVGTVAEGAAVELVVVPVTVRCGRCGRDTECEEATAVCPACGGTDVELMSGDELVLESIEVEGPVHVSRNTG